MLTLPLKSMQLPCHEISGHQLRLYLDKASPGSQDCVTTQMTLDARGTEMTPAPAWVVRHGKLINEIRECWSSLQLGAVNTRACLFGSRLALHSIEFRAGRIAAPDLQQRIKERLRTLVDGPRFGSEERKKRNVDVGNDIFDNAVPCADDTPSVLVCFGRLGKRGKRPVFSRNKHLLSRLNPSQVNC